MRRPAHLPAIGPLKCNFPFGFSPINIVINCYTLEAEVFIQSIFSRRKLLDVILQRREKKLESGRDGKRRRKGGNRRGIGIGEEWNRTEKKG